MSNKDFRAILATPRAGGRTQPSDLPAGKVTIGRTDGDDHGDYVDNPAMKAQKKKKWRPKKEEENDEEEDQGPHYR